MGYMDLVIKFAIGYVVGSFLLDAIRALIVWVKRIDEEYS